MLICPVVLSSAKRGQHKPSVER